MWILFAVGSSFFAGITAILAKCGIQKTDSDVATAVRTIVVLLMAWLMVFVQGKQKEVKDIEKKSSFLSDFQVSRQEPPGSAIIVLCRKDLQVLSCRLINSVFS